MLKDKFKIEELDIYRNLIEHMGDEIILVRKDGKIVFVNDATVKAMGYSRKYMLGKPITYFIEGDITPEEWHRIRFLKLKKQRRPLLHIVQRVIKSGRIQVIEVTGVYMKYKDQEYVLSVARDVTEKNKLESLLKESDKMKALQNFIVGTTQEIQSPLKGLQDRSDILIEKYKDRDFEYIGFKEFKNIMDSLISMRDQAKYCYDTLDRALCLNKKKAGLKSYQCNVNAVIQDAVEMLEHQFDISGVKLKLSLAGDIPLAAIGSVEFSQAMINIVTNAVQSIAVAGKILIKTTVLKHENKIQIICQDNGVGISKNFLSRVFEPFFTTKSRGLEKSSGLGLSIVYSIITAVKGDVFIKSTQRQGTSVKVLLPISSCPHTDRS